MSFIIKRIPKSFPLRTFCNLHNDKMIKTEFGFKINPHVQDGSSEGPIVEAKSSEVYFNLLDQHSQMKIPFTDEKYYKELFKISSQIINNSTLESWIILDRYVILNIDYIDKAFLVEIVEQFSKFKHFNFEFWYMIEKWVTKHFKSLSDHELAVMLYSFAYADKGSNYLYDHLFAKEVLDRGLKTFTSEDFILIYNGFRFSKTKDRFLWLMLNRARKEVHSDVNVEEEGRL